MALEPKILIVEDSPSQSIVIADIVRELGYNPAVYNDLPTSITQILEKEQPLLVLLDLKLVDENGTPFGDGFQLCREIKRSALKPPVIVISARGDDEACEWAVLQGADAYLQKPFAAEELKHLIDEVTSKYFSRS